MAKSSYKIKQSIYQIKGMHCASCEILIERILLQQKNIKSVDATNTTGELKIGYQGKKPTVSWLNRLIGRHGYKVGQDKNNKTIPFIRLNAKRQIVVNRSKLTDFLIVVGASLLMIIIFLQLNRSGFTSLLSVNAKSAIPAFFIFGLLAGLSTCSALVGCIILSMSKQWYELYGGKNSFSGRFQPHLIFNFGRLISYALFGGLLGLIGSRLQLSLGFGSVLTIAVSLIMLFLGLQMLGMRGFSKFKIAMPKFTSRFVANEKNFQGKWMPFLMGAGTFILPCGFTITAQGLALTSGSWWQGMLIMFTFALGTLGPLLLIGLSSIGFMQKPHLANRFLKVAGVLVVFFAFFNINSQLNVLGLSSLNDVIAFSSNSTVKNNGLPPLINGKQLVKSKALAYGYNPNFLQVRAGVPVRWEITDEGTSGCTNAIVSRGLFDGQINLTPGQTSVKEFTPSQPGRYKYSCWMGMVSGVIEVVDEKGIGENPVFNNKVI